MSRLILVVVYVLKSMSRLIACLMLNTYHDVVSFEEEDDDAAAAVCTGVSDVVVVISHSHMPYICRELT